MAYILNDGCGLYMSRLDCVLVKCNDQWDGTNYPNDEDIELVVELTDDVIDHLFKTYGAAPGLSV